MSRLARADAVRTTQRPGPDRELAVPANPTPEVRTRGLPNAALARAVLAREPPKPGEQPAHQQAFDAFVAAMLPDSTVAGLSAARKAVDRPGVATEETLTYNGRSLIVDQRNLTAVMTRIRWRAMDRIHELMSSEEATTDDARAQIRSYVRFLFGEEGGPIKDPESALKRFEHWYPKVTASVLAAVQQRAADAGDAAVGGAADADAGRKKVGMQEVKVDEIDPATGKKTGKKVTVIDPLTGKPKLEQANWCGAFAALLSERAGANPANSHLLNHESPLRSTFSYGVSQKIEVDGQVLDVKAYHSARGSMRSVVKFPDVIKDPESIDLQPGDIVLLDNARGLDPDHIQTCVFYNNHTGMLTTVGGNEGSGKAEVTVVNKGSRDLREQQAPNDVTKTDGPKHVRVWGRARWSIVDFEPHVYPKA